MKLIGISGKKKSGKDLAYQIINSQLSSLYVATKRYAFADEVKRVASDYFGYQEDEKEQKRFVLQGIGQMMRDEVDKNYWVNTTIAKIKADELKFSKNNTNLVAVVTDVRYRNEVESILSAGGTMLRIERPINNSLDTHPSEVDLDDYRFEHVIINDKSKEDYIQKVRVWAREFQLR